MSASYRGRSAIVLLLMALLTILGVTGIAGGVGMLMNPDGSAMGLDLSMLDAVPVDSFFLPGLVLFFIFGLLPLTVVYGIWARPKWRIVQRINLSQEYHWSWTWTRNIAVMLLIWVGIEFLMWGMASPLIPLYAGLAVALYILSGYDSVQNYLRLK